MGTRSQATREGTPDSLRSTVVDHPTSSLRLQDTTNRSSTAHPIINNPLTSNSSSRDSIDNQFTSNNTRPTEPDTREEVLLLLPLHHHHHLTDKDRLTNNNNHPEALPRMAAVVVGLRSDRHRDFRFASRLPLLPHRNARAPAPIRYVAYESN